MNAGKVGTWMAIALLTWGVAALGASRPWGYLPLLAGMTAYGAAALWTQPAHIGRGLAWSWLGICIAVSFQLIPLPDRVLAVISPALKMAAGTSASVPRTLSIDPAATSLGLAFILALGAFFIGILRTLRGGGTRRLVSGLVGLGVLVAAVGIAETSTHWNGVYASAGLPGPPDSTPYGPFSSKNHYAGWMLMTLALTLGYHCANVEQARRLWSRRVIAVQCALTAMAVALVQTRSRAAVLGLAITVMVMGFLLMRRSGRTRNRVIIAAAFAVLFVTGVAITGVQAIERRFVTTTWATAHGRLPIWRQTLEIAREFPLTGAGFNTYQRVVEFYPQADLDRPYEGAHNDYLQLAAEGGLLVGLPLLSVLGCFLWEVRQRFRDTGDDHTTRWLRIGAVVGLALIALQETVDFSLQVPGNAALCVVLAAIAVHRAPPKRRETAHGRFSNEVTQVRGMRSYVQ